MDRPAADRAAASAAARQAEAMERRTLTLNLLQGTYAVARLEPGAETPGWARGGGLTCLTWTRDELSVVCDESRVPSHVRAQRGFRCLQVAGPLEFSAIGILSSLAGAMAEAGISIFALSTYDTDYLLFPASQEVDAVAALRMAGHVVAGPDLR